MNLSIKGMSRGIPKEGKSEIEEAIKRLTSHKGVQGAIIQSADGSPIRSTFDDSTTVQHCALWQQLITKSRSAVRDLDPSNDLMFLRVRTKTSEVMISFDLEYSLIVVQSVGVE